MNKKLFKKGFLKLLYFLFFAFSGLIIIYQAFKNKSHLLYIPVLIIGLIFFFLAILNGFNGFKILVNSFLGKKKNNR